MVSSMCRVCIGLWLLILVDLFSSTVCGNKVLQKTSPVTPLATQAVTLWLHKHEDSGRTPRDELAPPRCLILQLLCPNQGQTGKHCRCCTRQEQLVMSVLVTDKAC